jgi:excisionase family DNA binding protein
MNSAALLEGFITQLKEEVREVVMSAVTAALAKEAPVSIGKPVSDILTIDEAADFLRKKKKTIYGLVAKKGIPFIKEGRNLRFSRERLETWIKSFQRKTIQELADEAEGQMLLSIRGRE